MAKGSISLRINVAGERITAIAAVRRVGAVVCEPSPDLFQHGLGAREIGAGRGS